jgi:hypothetical protein
MVFWERRSLPPKCWDYRRAPPHPPPVVVCATSVWAQGLMLARQALYHLSHSASPFLLVMIFFFFFGSSGVWTQGFTFARQVLYHLNHSASSPAFFCVGDFVLGSHKLFAQLASNHNPPDLCSWMARIAEVSHWHRLFTVWFCSHLCVSPGDWFQDTHTQHILETQVFAYCKSSCKL